MRAACCGSTPGRAEDLAEELVEEQSVVALLSFGLCGGLDPRVKPGTLIIPDRVIAEDDPTGFRTDERWRAALRARLPDARTGPLLGHDEIVATVAEKAELYALTGALAVDMESMALPRSRNDTASPSWFYARCATGPRLLSPAPPLWL